MPVPASAPDPKQSDCDSRPEPADTLEVLQCRVSPGRSLPHRAVHGRKRSFVETGELPWRSRSELAPMTGESHRGWLVRTPRRALSRQACRLSIWFASDAYLPVGSLRPELHLFVTIVSLLLSMPLHVTSRRISPGSSLDCIMTCARPLNVER
jgi:hypothetical protein